MNRVCIDVVDVEALTLNKSSKGKDVFVHISCGADLEVIFAKALKELPQRMLMLIPELK